MKNNSVLLFKPIDKAKKLQTHLKTVAISTLLLLFIFQNCRVQHTWLISLSF